MSAKTIMIQGTTSNAGKSVLATALCAIFAAHGLRTAPFKAWNMSSNSYVSKDGLEIARSQGIQAEVIGIEATGDMNPFFLKPQGNGSSQIMVRGKPLRTKYAGGFRNFALPIIEESLLRLTANYEVVVMEGAGSPVELNMKQNEVANMAVARLVQAPVLIVADINRGGSLAGIIGTFDLLEPREKKLVIGSVLNKFRGDPEILKPGCQVIEEHTKLLVVGVIPFAKDHGVGQEDGAFLDQEPILKNGHDVHDFAGFVAQVREHLDFDYICQCMGLDAMKRGV